MVKIDLKTKSCSGVEFSTSGHAYTDSGKASGNLETKYKVCNYGLIFTQKWNTDNTLGTEISWENKLAEGLKLTLDTIFVPNTGKKSRTENPGQTQTNANTGPRSLVFRSPPPVVLVPAGQCLIGSSLQQCPFPSLFMLL